MFLIRFLKRYVNSKYWFVFFLYGVFNILIFFRVIGPKLVHENLFYNDIFNYSHFLHLPVILLPFCFASDRLFITKLIKVLFSTFISFLSLVSMIMYFFIFSGNTNYKNNTRKDLVLIDSVHVGEVKIKSYKELVGVVGDDFYLVFKERDLFAGFKLVSHEIISPISCGAGTLNIVNGDEVHLKQCGEVKVFKHGNIFLDILNRNF